jgi:hypothetical protein
LNDFGDWIIGRSYVARDYRPNPLSSELGRQYLKGRLRPKNILVCPLLFVEILTADDGEIIISYQIILRFDINSENICDLMITIEKHSIFERRSAAKEYLAIV